MLPDDIKIVSSLSELNSWQFIQEHMIFIGNDIKCWLHEQQVCKTGLILVLCPTNERRHYMIIVVLFSKLNPVITKLDTARYCM